MRLEDFPDEICAWCGGGFEGKHPNQKYCCYECRRQSTAAFMKTVWREQHRRACHGRTCEQCGKTYDATRRTQKYCSQRCGGNAWFGRRVKPKHKARMEARAGRTCRNCGTIFDALRDSQWHCSKLCRERDRRLAGRSRVTACVECGKPIPASRRTDTTTCSLRCQKRNWNKRNRERNRAQARKRYARRKRAERRKSNTV